VPVATNRRFIPAPPETVWRVLADPKSYAYWVVGSKRIRDADPGWPAPGSRFHHTVGVGPLTVDDHTESLAADPPRRLVLRAMARPIGLAKVEIELEPERDGTCVTLTENPTGIQRPLAYFPPLQALTWVRNAESLARIERLAVGNGG
jgi:uncharacterized protein YndB with AHSA1/START domain